METLVNLAGNIITIIIIVVIAFGGLALMMGGLWVFFKIFTGVMEMPDDDRNDLIIATIIKDKLMK